ncbi:chromosome segregation protein SMC [Salinisphaera sp. T31B1]|uniref:chromosome segregation protein SMC n=1 Tax=Salinisphaera sp. T31B1 TaxID=727963 RepID=UPI003341D959
MRLSSIRLAGFKSFVDPTTLSLASNLTGVVGPNGCGKSNVIDAVRWVTGESSARQLRGEALEDVIFNGSKARKPVGRASVELRFDNSEGKLGGQYGAFSEISIRRELARDGGSRYAINGTRARRRDVIDLFLGTGLGGRSNYAVIEQGAVNRLIEARPEDMRQVLEEAAGISKYKERRRETENRIRHTRENLDRLNDLIGEVSQRLTVLKRQAANAEKYKTFKADERRLRAELLALRWSSQNEQTRAAEAQLRATEDRLRQAISVRREAQAARDADQAEQQAIQTRVQQAQAAFYDAQGRVGRIEQALAHAREVSDMREREHKALLDQIAALEARRDEDERRRGELVVEGERLERQRSEADAQLIQARSARDAAQAEARAAEQAWDEHNAAEHNPVQQLDAERTRADYARQQRDKLAERDRVRRGEREAIPALDQASLDRQADELTERERALAADLDAAEREAEADRGLRSRLVELEREVAERTTALAEQQAELASERKMQQAVLREDDDRINAWLAARGHGQARGVARRIRVREAWRTAAEVALGPLLRGFVVESLDAGTTGDWPGEPVALIEDRDWTLESSSAPAPAECLADGLEGPAAIRAAAGRLFVVADLATGLAMRHQLRGDQQLITLDGCRIGPASLITPAGQSAEQGVFEREQRIESLAAAVDEGQQDVEARRHSLAECREHQQATQARCARLDQGIGEQRRAIETAGAQLQGEQLRAEQNTRRRAEIDSELAELAEQVASADEDHRQAAVRVEELESQARIFADDRKTIQARRHAARNALERERATAAQAERQLRDLEVEQTRIADRAESVAVRIGDSEQARADLAAKLERFEAQQPADNGEHHSADDLAEARQAQQAADRSLREARSALSACEQAMQDKARAVMAAEQGVEDIRDALQQARIDVETAGVRRAGLTEQLEELGEAPLPLLEALPEDADAAQWGEAIEALERKIQRLGAINLAAIEEYDAEAEREAYLAEQHTDLSEALATLEAAIAKIDRETRARFKATYEQVNARFAEMFPELFGGGEAALELTEDDWLATGIRVMARPPGKRNASIQMLSGGEKALTAVALLFALFELNPAPFCMLDEIDAPLDDANVSRFCELVRRMSAQVQFIVITHNKLTMSLAEQLHGVTMAEPGVSRLVSVDIEQALDMAG